MDKAKRIATVLGPIPRNGSEIYAVCKQIDGQPEADGSFQIAALRVVKFYLYENPQVFYEPLSKYSDIRQSIGINHLLFEAGLSKDYRNSISVSFKTFKSIYTAPGGVVPFPKHNEMSKGTHAVPLTDGWDPREEMLQFANSWGRSWGDEGCGWLSRQYLEMYLTEAWLMRKVDVGPTPITWHSLLRAKDANAFVKIWLKRNRIWNVPWRHRKDKHHLVRYEKSSVEGFPIDVIEIRNGLGIRVAWAHVHHVENAKTRERISIIKELFVWPKFRRQAYATKLETVACERGRKWRSRRMHVLFHEADASVHVRAAGEAFASCHGYTLTWLRHERPNVEAIAKKEL